MRIRSRSVYAFLAFLSGIVVCIANAGPIITRVDTNGDVGPYSSVQMNGSNPVVSYYDESRGDLKLATCTAGCSGRTPTWVTTTVDDTGNVGWYTSLQLGPGGNPVIAYYDVTRGKLKLATCTAACATAAPTWVITTVDSFAADVGRFPSLLLNGGVPVIAYRDRTNGDLKLATCRADCATPFPEWVITVVDQGGDVGRFTSMQLNAGRPVIAYFDLTNGTVKTATCTANCASASPSWVFAVVDSVPNEDETKLSLQLDRGSPVVSYYDAVAKRLKLATCTAACGTGSPAWVITVVDAIGSSGVYSTLQLRHGNPVIAYHAVMFNCTRAGAQGSCHGALDLRLAVCTAACASATPTWVITTIDNSDSVGWDPAMVLDGDRAVASYLDMASTDLKVAYVDLAVASLPQNYTAMWWDPLESGWGVNFSHQGDIVFGSLFSYDTAGRPMWLFMPSGARQPDGSFAGALYRATGPAFNAKPFTPINASNLTTVGSMSVTFRGDSASLAYVADGNEVNKTIKKFVFGSEASFCQGTTGDRRALANYQDLWWNEAESGWGLEITHQGNILFATLFTYDATGRPLWLMAPAALRQPDGSYRGDFYRTTGPAFNSVPFVSIGPANVIKVGSLELRFASGESGTLSYSVDGVSVEKAITRDAFASPVPACVG